MRKIIPLLTATAIALTAGLAAAAPASGAPSLRFHGAQYDSPGPDLPVSNAKLVAEWISLINTGPTAVNLKGYTIRDKAGYVYTIQDFTIAANGGRFWLKTGSGSPTARTRYWGRGYYVWNNDGDTAYLRRPTGTTVDTCSWGYKSGRSWVAC